MFPCISFFVFFDKPAWRAFFTALSLTKTNFQIDGMI